MVITVLLIDDHELIRQGLSRAFERNGDFQIVGEAGTVSEGRLLARRLQPDVLVTDVRLPDGTGFELARCLRDENETIGIVVLTMYAGDDALLAALESGASAFVSKDAVSDEVLAAARHAAHTPRSFAAKDLVGAMQRRRQSSAPALSAREMQVLELLAEGVGVAGISQALYVSQSTAKTHISRIYEKLGAGNRAQAIMTAVRMGVLSDKPTSRD